MKSVIAEVKAAPQPIILFIDEAHTMIGAGGQAGQSAAANLLKPALARGELRTIAATTWAEYKKYFEKDAALARRFQVVKVEEPTEAQAIVMMRGLLETLETHHNIRILDEALADAVKLSHRYITGRQLPDKSVSVLDTACARVALGQISTPSAVEDATRRIAQLAGALGTLNREAVTGTDHSPRIAALQAERVEQETRLAGLQAQWEEERALIAQLSALRAQLEEQASKHGDGATESELTSLRATLHRLNQELALVQGETPLMQPCVTSQTIAEVISGWTGIPVGVFLLVGPSGVGKTETALALAETLFGGERNLITIYMEDTPRCQVTSLTPFEEVG